MYILNYGNFSDFNLKNSSGFVDFWNQFYKDHERTEDYIYNLNIGQNLKRNNVRWLIDWKLPKPHRENEIDRVLGQTARLNQFRNGNLSENEFKELVAQIYRTGFVMPVFLFHISRPQQYPIWDRFVINAFQRHIHNIRINGNIINAWDAYDRYRQYIDSIGKACFKGFPSRNNERCVRNLKQIDNALWAFGKFLAQYGGL